MKIVSWNCLNGFSKGKPEAIFSTFADADIFVIQECKKTDVNSFKYDWKFKNWYGDDQDIKSDLGVAIFSKKHEVEFTEIFNRNFRYVVPYKIIVDKKSFVLFLVWTKSAKRGLFSYDENIIQAINSSEYEKLLSNSIIIGDYNTGYIEKYSERYTKLLENMKAKGFRNCSSKKIEDFDMTFHFNKNGKKYLNDFCFVSKHFKGKILNFQTEKNWIDEKGKMRWNGSDHCPIMVEFKF